jgi:hypothetical protein
MLELTRRYRLQLLLRYVGHVLRELFRLSLPLLRQLIVRYAPQVRIRAIWERALAETAMLVHIYQPRDLLGIKAVNCVTMVPFQLLLGQAPRLIVNLALQANTRLFITDRFVMFATQVLFRHQWEPFLSLFAISAMQGHGHPSKEPLLAFYVVKVHGQA